MDESPEQAAVMDTVPSPAPSAADVDNDFSRLLTASPGSLQERKPKVHLLISSETVDFTDDRKELLYTSSEQEVEEHLEQIMDGEAKAVGQARPAQLNIPFTLEAPFEQPVLLTPSVVDVDRDFGRLLEGNPSGLHAPLSLSVPEEGPESPPGSVPIIPTPSAAEIDAELAKLAQETGAPTFARFGAPGLQLQLDALDPAPESFPAAMLTPSVEDVDRDFGNLLVGVGVASVGKGFKGPSLSLAIPAEEPCEHHCPPALETPSRQQVDADFGSELERGLPVFPLSGNSRSTGALQLNTEFGDPSEPMGIAPLETPSRQQVDADFEKEMQKGKPCLSRSLSIEVARDEDAPPSHHVTLETPSRQQVDADLEKEMQKGKPSLSRSLSVEIVRDEDAPLTPPPPVLETPSAHAVDADFARLLETGPPSLTQSLSVRVPQAQEEEPPLIVAPLLESHTIADVEADFGKLLESGPGLLTPQLALDVDTEDQRLEDLSPVLLQTPSMAEVDEQFARLTAADGENDGEGLSGEASSSSAAAEGPPPAALLQKAGEDSAGEGVSGEAVGGVEDDTCESWRRRNKHLFVLSNAGKPIYSRYGDENALAGFMAILQAMISFVQDSGDTLHSLRAGVHQ
eukprot:gene25616-31319_t